MSTMTLVAMLMPSFQVEAAAETRTEPNGLLESIFSDWRQRQQDAGQVLYRINGTRTWFAGSFESDPIEKDEAPPNPEFDLTGAFARTVLFDLPGNRFRVENSAEKYDNLSRSIYRVRSIWAGDGEVVRARALEDSLPGLGHGRARRHEDFWIMREEPSIIPPMLFERGYGPLFYASGVVPAGGTVVRPTLLVPDIDPAAFSFVDYDVIEGRRCAVLRERITDFWVDLERQSAIIQVVVNVPQPRLVRRIEYQQTASGWLPERWTIEQFRDGRPVLSEEVVVEEVILNPSLDDATFVLAAEPGMYVREIQAFLDQATGQVQRQSRYYRLERSGRKTELDANLFPIRRSWRPGVTILVLALLALAPLLLIHHIIQHSQKKSSAL